MERVNLALFVVEAVAYFAIMVTLLHFRQRIGLGVFLTALGVMHFMETYLAADLSAESGEPVTLPLNNQALSAVQDLYKKFRTPV